MAIEPHDSLDLSSEQRQEVISLRGQQIPTENRQGNELLRKSIYRLLKLNDEQIGQIEKDIKELEEYGDLSTYNAEEREWEWKILDMVRNVKKWPLPRLSEWKDSVDSVEVVVHPLYGLFVTQWDPVLWNSCNGDVDKYILDKLIVFSKEAFEELRKDPTSFPSAYFVIRDVLEELDALRTSPQSGQLRIFDLPRRAMLSNLQIQAYDQLLKTVASQQTVVIDSMHRGTGTIQEEDIEHMKGIIVSHGTVEFQGGYLNACIDAAVDSFIKSVSRDGEKDVKVVVDSQPSTSMMSARTSIATKIEREKQISQAESSGLPQDVIVSYREYADSTLVLPPAPPTTIVEMRQWIDQNRDLNEKKDRFVRLQGAFFTAEIVGDSRVIYK